MGCRQCQHRGVRKDPTIRFRIHVAERRQSVSLSRTGRTGWCQVPWTVGSLRVATHPHLVSRIPTPARDWPHGHRGLRGPYRGRLSGDQFSGAPPSSAQLGGTPLSVHGPFSLRENILLNWVERTAQFRVKLFYPSVFPAPMARFAKRVLSIEPSPTVRISDLIAESQGQGKKILSLAIGEPDFPTPAHIVEAAKKALDDGFTKYTAAPGIRELREAIAEKSHEENGIPAKAENVIVAPTKHTLFMTFMALLDPGDEALIPDPGWVSYAPMVTLAGAKPVPIRAADEDGFVPSTETVADAITPRTRLLVLNSPSNPAGSVYSRSQMRGLADLAADHDLTVVSGEIYEKILYGGEARSPAALEGMFDRTVTVNGFSKTYSMTGWRLGWLVAPTPMVRQIGKVQEHTITCATAFAQQAGVAALRGPTAPLKAMVDEFRARRGIVLRGLPNIDRLSTDRPSGAFYVFPPVDVGLASASLAERILTEANVAVTPGSAFGEAGEGHLRLSYAASRETIVECIRRIGDVLKRI